MMESIAVLRRSGAQGLGLLLLALLGGCGGGPVGPEPPAPACTVGTDCPGENTDCQTRTCKAGVCGMDYVAIGTPTKDNVAGDCQQKYCDANGVIKTAVDDTDSPALPSDVCAVHDACMNGSLVSINPNGGLCDDLDGCTKTDICENNACVGSNTLACYEGATCSAGACTTTKCTGLLGLPGPPLAPLAPAGNFFAPTSMATGDLNGDGHFDLAMANTQGVDIFLGQGKGTFAPVSTHNVGAEVDGIALADWSGDGKLDLAVTIQTGSVYVALGQGNGTFGTGVKYAVGSVPVAIATADLNGDTKLDLVVANLGSGGASVLLNQGNGTFTAAANYPSINSASAVVLADITGDGLLDIFVANRDLSNGLYWGLNIYRQFPNGTFSGPSSYAMLFDARSIAVLDLNGDNLLDVLLTGPAPAKTLLNTGTNDFVEAMAMPSDPIADQVVTAEMNGDGRLDLIFRERNSVSVRLQQNDGTFADSFHALVTECVVPCPMAAQDIDSDGRLDIVIADHDSGHVNVLLGKGNGVLEGPTTLNAGKPNAEVIAADLNGDDFPDLVVSDGDLDTVSVMLGQGQGTFGPPSPQAVEKTFGGHASVAADFNRDGKVDLAVTNFYNHSVSVLINKGNGGFVPAVHYDTVQAPGTLIAADLDGSGYPDLALGGSDAMGLLVNKGDGTFLASAVVQGSFATGSIAPADLDGDGKIDLAVSGINTIGAKVVSIFTNMGNGVLAQSKEYVQGDDLPSIKAADINGDTKPDLVLWGYTGISVMPNKGDGTFPVKDDYLSGQDISSVAIVDFDSDGKLDLAAAFSVHNLGVMMNKGNGSMAAPIPYLLGDFPRSLVATDLNLDGRGDLVAVVDAEAVTRQVSILMNVCRP